MSEESKAFAEPTWAIVELFGHHVIAGQISEVTIAGGPFLRVDVPEVDGQPAYTKFFGAQAIYGITPAGEDEARKATKRLRVRPVALWIVPDPEPQLPAPEEYSPREVCRCANCGAIVEDCETLERYGGLCAGCYQEDGIDEDELPF